MMWGYNGYGFGGIGMGYGSLLFRGLIIAAVALLARGFGARRGAGEHSPSDKSALDILRERYARGEIDKAEFDEKRRDLAAG